MPGNPLEHLSEYQQLTEASLLVNVVRWVDRAEASQRELGHRWRGLLRREIPWKMVCQRNLVFVEDDSEPSSIFSQPEWVEQSVRRELGAGGQQLPLRWICRGTSIDRTRRGQHVIRIFSSIPPATAYGRCRTTSCSDTCRSVTGSVASIAPRWRWLPKMPRPSIACWATGCLTMRPTCRTRRPPWALRADCGKLGAFQGSYAIATETPAELLSQAGQHVLR